VTSTSGVFELISFIRSTNSFSKLRKLIKSSFSKELFDVVDILRTFIYSYLKLSGPRCLLCTRLDVSLFFSNQ